VRITPPQISGSSGISGELAWSSPQRGGIYQAQGNALGLGATCLGCSEAARFAVINGAPSEHCAGQNTVTQGVALGYSNIAPLGQNTQSSPEMPDEPNFCLIAA
jgi:hypothetical protein